MKSEHLKKNVIQNAIKSLKSGELIVYPTDTLYALGADIHNEKAVKKVFMIKNRPFSNPLPVAVANFTQMSSIAYTNEMVYKIVTRFLPGPLTLILYKKESVCSLVTGGLDKIAVRIPNNPIALELLQKCGSLTVTSANIHGEKTPYIINEIMMQFTQEISVYVDDGRLQGQPSTIIDVTSETPIIVRPGLICLNEIVDAIE
jgi:L-threonylcarbamoyladenylate synthase